MLFRSSPNCGLYEPLLGFPGKVLGGAQVKGRPGARSKLGVASDENTRGHSIVIGLERETLLDRG